MESTPIRSEDRSLRHLKSVREEERLPGRQVNIAVGPSQGTARGGRWSPRNQGSGQEVSIESRDADFQVFDTGPAIHPSYLYGQREIPTDNLLRRVFLSHPHFDQPRPAPVRRSDLPPWLDESRAGWSLPWSSHLPGWRLSSLPADCSSLQSMRSSHETWALSGQ